MSEDWRYRDTLKDDLRDFFREPSKDRLLRILDMVENEYDYLDFKREWPERSKLASHILAFINYGNGVIVCGIDDSGDSLESVGVEEAYDPAEFGQKVEKYLPDGYDDLYTLNDYSYDGTIHHELAGKRFQVLFIQSDLGRIPVLSSGDGDNIDSNTIYIRRNTQSVKANHGEISELIERRLYHASDEISKELEDELRELKTLYSQIDRKVNFPTNKYKRMALFIEEAASHDNPDYPDEGYDEFIANTIAAKKERIRQLIGVQ